MTTSMGADDTSRALAARARAGNRAAFEELVSLHQEAIERHVASRLRARGLKASDTEDVTQEILLRGFRSLRNFEWEGESSFLRWICGIAENVALEMARRAARNPVTALRRDVAATTVSPSVGLRREERFSRLEKALEGLSPDHRTAILLTRVEGLGFEEAAKRMGRSPYAVKQLLWRALKKLKTKFGDTESLHLPDRCLGEEEGHGR
jgi:RNA polymerase sigma-70 factor (ECF subfamily)